MFNQLPASYDAWKTDPGPAYEGTTAQEEALLRQQEQINEFPDKLKARCQELFAALHREAGLGRYEAVGWDAALDEFVSAVSDSVVHGERSVELVEQISGAE